MEAKNSFCPIPASVQSDRSDPGFGGFMITALLIFHGLLGVALLGAITHQTISVWLPIRKTAASFVGRFRGVEVVSYVNAVVVLYVATAIVGAIIYPSYRVSVRLVLQQLDLNVATGLFELKEHFVAVGLGLLPPIQIECTMQRLGAK
jgi:hypothetical protein